MRPTLQRYIELRLDKEYGYVLNIIQSEFEQYDFELGGIENAITVGLEQKKKGKSISVRLDSGDLFYLSREIRKRLDNAGLEDVRIVVSNDLKRLIPGDLFNYFQALKNSELIGIEGNLIRLIKYPD